MAGSASIGSLVVDRLKTRGESRWPYLALGTVAILATMVIAVAQGAVAIPAPLLLEMIWARLPFASVNPSWPATFETIVFEIRLPRVVLGALVGAALATAGATYQGLFRNPLADPYLLGVASGAALGAVLAMSLALPVAVLGLELVPLAAFLGALATVALVYLIGRVGRTTPMTTLLLAGVALGSFFSSVTYTLMLVESNRLHAIFSWLLGGLYLSNWQQVLAISPYVAGGTAVIWLCARALNVMQLEEEQAQQLGLDVDRLKLFLVAAASLVTAAAVSVAGLIGFVGLIVPHLVRLIWGPDHRFLLPMSALIGAVFLMLADTLARTAFAPNELPVGIVTALCGVPFFIYLLRQKKREVF